MASWKQGHARTIFWWKFWFDTASASLFIYLFLIILPWPFISASGLTVLLCSNCYLICFIPKRIQLIKAARKIFSRGLRAQELSGGVCILCICVRLLLRKREEEVTKIRKLPYVFSHRKWYGFVFCFISTVTTSQSLCLSQGMANPVLTFWLTDSKYFKVSLQFQPLVEPFLTSSHGMDGNKQLEMLYNHND